MQRIRQLVEEKAELGGETLKGIHATVVAPFVQRCRDCSGYDDVLAEYRLLAEEAGVPAERFACTREDTVKMKQAVETLKAVLLRRREREYIHEKLDEAIRELGYELVGDGQTGRDGHHKLHELYLFTEGTVIETIVDEQGKITMQLCGVGTTDREPTAAEAAELVRIMDGDFCTFFRGRLVEKLAEYGIEMPSFSHAPATGDVAQIINANDYHLSRPLNSFRVVSRNNAAGDRRAKTMGEEE